MGSKLFLFGLLLGCAAAQSPYRVCLVTPTNQLCQSFDRDDSNVVCRSVESRIDCALQLSRGEADLGYFSEEEMMLLSQQQPTDNVVVASVRDVNRMEPFAFEAVAIVSSSHTGGLEGLRGSNYCHPGLGQGDLRWSPRVLKAFEQQAARTDRCPETETNGKTAEELEVEQLNSFFGAACRPGPWSANDTVDVNLKSRYQSLCSICGLNGTCDYSIDMGVSVAGVNNNNRHIQALECMRRNNNSVAFVAWAHVREFFNIRSPQESGSYAVLCPDGTLANLTTEVLNSATSPCAFVRQPWGAILAAQSVASAVQTSLRGWWPNGASPGGNSWTSTLFSSVAGGVNARVVFEDGLPTTAAYTAAARNITAVDATSSCLPARRWCTLSANEQTKCTWLRDAAHVLGLQPPISCQLRTSIFECLDDIKESRADLIASASNYGYLARQHYSLSPVKLVQNSRSSPNSFSRVAALIKNEAAVSENITRFENLRGRKACFPEFGGIAYVAFVRAAHERGVISSSECDYARSVGEFFDGACAPGAADAAHSISESNFDPAPLCSLCRTANPVMGNWSDGTCSWDYSNMYFGNNGSLACLADVNSDVAFVETQNINSQLNALNLNATQFRVLCRNNSLALNPGLNIDDGCLLAHVVDSEILTRRNDPLFNSLNTLLDALDEHFGYNANSALINLEIYSPFNNINNLLFRDTAVGLSEPSNTAGNDAARNYIDLFSHLESCTSAAAPTPTPGLATRNFYSLITIVFMALFTRFIMY